MAIDPASRQSEFCAKARNWIIIIIIIIIIITLVHRTYT